MKGTTIRCIDTQGRVIIPMPLRRSLQWEPGRAVELVQEDDNTLRIRPAQEICAVCGKAITPGECADITQEKKLCLSCCGAALKAMKRK